MPRGLPGFFRSKLEPEPEPEPERGGGGRGVVDAGSLITLIATRSSLIRSALIDDAAAALADLLTELIYSMRGS